MIERFRAESDKVEETPLPFITISRLHGCGGKMLADALVKEINSLEGKKKNSQPWFWISKEILETSVRELSIDQDRVMRIFQNKWHGTIQEMLSSFTTKYYAYDFDIIRTITRVVRDFASRGNIVIVGRGGLEVTHGMNGGFHVSLIAPLGWRVKQVMGKEKIKSRAEAEKYIKDVDRRRLALRKKFNARMPGDYAYHTTFNCEHFSTDELAESIVKCMQVKKLL